MIKIVDIFKLKEPLKSHYLEVQVNIQSHTDRCACPTALARCHLDFLAFKTNLQLTSCVPKNYWAPGAVVFVILVLEAKRHFAPKMTFRTPKSTFSQFT